MTNLIKKHNGFTLLETIAILIIIGIISVVVVTSMMQTSSSLVGQTAVFKTHLRYAQTLAMNSDTGEIWGIRADLSNEYYWLYHCDDPLNCDSTAANSRVLPSEEADSSNRIQLAGQDLNILSMTSGDAVAFANNGTPLQGATAFVPLTADFEIVLKDNITNETRKITITEQTGFIP
jgi:type II secretory pathway pseudopilin PulG